MTITSTGIYGTSSTIVTSDLYEDVEQLKIGFQRLLIYRLLQITTDA